MRKLTLSASDEVIEQAKRIARRNGTSVSAIFARFVHSLSHKNRTEEDIPAGSLAARATGIVRLPKGKTPRDVLTDALMEKYGAKKK